jgi:hypothetical protein
MPSEVGGEGSRASSHLTPCPPAPSRVAVVDAYGWPHDLSDEEILARLLALNAERAGIAKT